MLNLRMNAAAILQWRPRTFPVPSSMPPFSDFPAIDVQRRFGGIDRLFGPQGMARLRQAQVIVAGIGGVGSWCAEALARSGVGALTLIDLDHVSESNVNRQLHALTSTIGQAKTEAMAQRIAQINPDCRVTTIDAFVEPDNAADLIAADSQVLVDCTDQMAAKIAMIRLTAQRGAPIVVCGGAGGKTDPLRLRAGDLAHACHDALLAKLRQRLRCQYGYPAAVDAAGRKRKRVPTMGVRCLWVDQPALLPQAWQPGAHKDQAPQGLSCAGYGSVVTVTASMGLAAAHEAMRAILDHA